MMVRLFTFLICCTPLSLIGQVLFQDQAANVGVSHSYGTGIAGGGLSVVDINGDGWDDLSLASQEGDVIQVYLNNNGVFELQSNLALNNNETKQILWVDLDNDGDKDLFITVLNGIDRLFENIGDLTLLDITPDSGLPFIPSPTYGATFGDFNRDGFLDLYYVNKDNVFDTNQSYLFQNNGNLTFTDVTIQSQTADMGKAPFCSAFFDVENDGWPDIYTAHDKNKINTLLSNNGDGTFTDAGMSTGTNLVMNAMCTTIGDYDNNGFLDIYVTNLPAGNALLQNNGDGTFTDVAAGSGTLFNGTGWASNFLDADNDGDLDLYVSASIASADAPTSTFYLNNGDGIFSEPYAGFEGDTVTVYSNAIGDYNNDGYPDIFTNTYNDQSSRVWGNQGGNHHFIKVRLEGVISNRDAIGSFIEVYVNGNRYMRYTHCGEGYLGQNSNTQIIGIGDAEAIDSLRVIWSTGHIDVLYQPAINTSLSILEGSTTDGEILVDPSTSFGDNTTNIQITSLLKPVILYPNPVSETLRIETSFHHYQHIEILRNDGTWIQEIPFRSSLEVGHLAKGHYYLRLIGENRVVVLPFLIID